MGYPYNKLVAPAVLFLNPGITRDEYVELLDNTHSSSYKIYSQLDDWSFFDSNLEDSRFHRELEGLARILGLPESDMFRKFQEPQFDENGFLISAPTVLPAREGKNYEYEVILHEGNVMGALESIDTISCGKLGVGDMCGGGVVQKIIKEEELMDEEDEFDEVDSEPIYQYQIEILHLSKVWDRQIFRTKEELFEEWPQFHPSSVYDWATRNGNFIGTEGVNNFSWVNKEEKYSLDSKTFDVIPASGYLRFFMGYTDLIMTAEAIKQSAWKALSYKGARHLNSFLREFSESKTRYDQAVWDSHTSSFAKQKSMTVNELLRFRLEKRGMN